MIIKLSDFGNLLLTRSQGEKAYPKFKEALKEDEIVTVDFTGVTVVGISFADQCFGMLIKEMGKATFFERMRFINASPETKSIVNTAINLRLARP